MSTSRCRAVWAHHARQLCEHAAGGADSGGRIQCQLSSRPTCSRLKRDITTGAACASDINAASPADAAAILAGSISLHCQATRARMKTAKSTGMGIDPLQHLAGTDAATSITFSATGSVTTHLGIFP